MTTPAQIGPYRVEGELGRGGMGVVYVAFDPSLLRRVAIKMLPDSLTRDPGRRARFQREARLLASIQHPNIAVVHSLERTPEGAAYLVMEHVRGESLAERILRGPIPVPEALRICRGVAKAVEAAHARGIVHRDLKPANVMASDDGQVKVLDFGLAASTVLAAEDPGADPQADTDVIGEALLAAPPMPPGAIPTKDTAEGPGSTRIGEVVGTPGYFSPEQARGLRAGPKSDIFSFGCLLFECLAGKRAFAGRSAAELHTAVLRNDPDWNLVPAGTPAPIRDLIARCLAKDPAQRPASMVEVRSALEEEMERPPSGRARRHNLPRELSSFVGREQELERILREQRSAPLLTLTGPGGCGKTRLALKAGLELLPDFPDGVWLVELASITDPERVPAAVASVLEVRETPGRPLAEALAEEIGPRSLLLLLDNCEHLVEACAELAQRLARSCPNLKILATSREILGITGEKSFRVPSLSLPDPDHEVGPEELARSEACRLFLERARAAAPAFRAGAPEAPAIGRICRLLDGIPLAIELAAARTRLLPLERIEALLHDRFRLLTGGSRTALERHQTLRATLDWSYALLNEPERRWLCTFSVFTGGWSLEGARAVGGEDADEIEILDVLTHLADKSLVIAEPEGQPPRYRMLEMVRQYAREKLEDEGELRRLRDRHLDYYLALVDRARTHLFGGAEQKRWLDLLDAEHENIQSAFQWTEGAAGGEGKAMKLVAMLAQFWYLRGHGRLARALLLRALERDTSSGPETGDERLNWRAGALNAAAHFLTVEGDFARARALIEEAVEVRRRIGPPLDLARVLFTLGANFWMTSRFEESRRAQEEALAIAREARHADMTAAALNALGANLYHQGDLEGARRYFEESLALRREADDRPHVAMVLNNLGALAALQGDFNTARRRQEEALSIQRELGNLAGILAVLEERGGLLAEHGERDAALRDYAEALEIARGLGEKPKIAGLYAAVAALHLRASRPELAAAPLRQALDAYREMGSSLDLAQALLLAAALAANGGDFARAARLFGAAGGHQGDASLQILPGEQALFDRHREAARRAMGEAAYDAADADGRGLSVQDGVDEALAALEKFAAAR